MGIPGIHQKVCFRLYVILLTPSWDNAIVSDSFRNISCLLKPSDQQCRVMAVYVVIDLFLDGISGLGNDEPYNCGTLSLLPLPCVRDIWEAPTISGWIKEYDRYLSTKEGDGMLITQTLMDTRLVAPFVSAEKGDPSNDIMQWCRGMDGLSTIIWMIIPLHKYRLREDVRDIW